MISNIAKIYGYDCPPCAIAVDDSRHGWEFAVDGQLQCKYTAGEKSFKYGFGSRHESLPDLSSGRHRIKQQRIILAFIWED